MDIRTQTYVIKACDVSRAYSCTTPREASSILRAMFEELDADREHFIVLALNAKGKVIGTKHVSSGLPTACLVSPREVFQAALILGAVTVLCAHNHPSGSCDPSREDLLLTKRLRESGEMIGVPLADHLIIGASEFYSFRANQGW